MVITIAPGPPAWEGAGTKAAYLGANLIILGLGGLPLLHPQPGPGMARVRPGPI
jgi:hypothetical protein